MFCEACNITTLRASLDTLFPQATFERADKACMDRRPSPRQPLQERVELTYLSLDSETGVSTYRSARIVERSAIGLRLVTAEPIKPSTLVRLDLADSLLLGEVVWCSKVGAHHHIGLKVEESLLHVQDLGRLMESLLGNDYSRTLHMPEAVEAGRY